MHGAEGHGHDAAVLQEEKVTRHCLQRGEPSVTKCTRRALHARATPGLRKREERVTEGRVLLQPDIRSEMDEAHSAAAFSH